MNLNDAETANPEAEIALAPVRDNSVVWLLVEDLESLSRPDAKYPQTVGIV